jgi:hypothetical protein
VGEGLSEKASGRRPAGEGLPEKAGGRRPPGEGRLKALVWFW